MKISIYLMIVAAFFLSGCSTIKNASYLIKTLPEIKQWNDYKIAKVASGIVRSSGGDEDISYVKNRLGKEFLVALTSVSPKATDKLDQEKLKKVNTFISYEVNTLTILKDKTTNEKFGYCTIFSLAGYKDGKKIDIESKDSNYMFAYLDKEKPISLFASSSGFTKELCGDDFDNKLAEVKNKNTK